MKAALLALASCTESTPPIEPIVTSRVARTQCSTDGDDGRMGSSSTSSVFHACEWAPGSGLTTRIPPANRTYPFDTQAWIECLVVDPTGENP